MGSNVIALRRVEGFLTDSLPLKLKRDLRAVRIVKEADRNGSGWLDSFVHFLSGASRVLPMRR